MDAHLISKPASSTKKIPVVEIFGPTIQGEGAVIGEQTMFVRFGLCDYKCAMCDSMHAVDPQLVKRTAAWLTQEEIYEEIVAKTPTHIHTITFSGGNPAIHDLSELVNRLHFQGYHIVVETQGTKHPEWLRLVSHIVVSPKSPGMGENFDHKVFEEFMHEVVLQMHSRSFSVKVVVFSAIDIEFAVHVASVLKKVFDESPAAERWNEWHKCFYLSLGNPLPPQFGITEDDQVENNSPANLALVEELLKRYNLLSDEVMKNKHLSFAKFLPQLHVLVWGNQTGK